MINGKIYVVPIMKTLRNIIAIVLIASSLGGCVTTAVLTGGGDNRGEQISQQIGI
ncbi:hypothetical protein GCM10010971_22750 [Silvimonas amylolytica]|uniref:Uncharacterized protein n=1 Tax=Silvimonas amylolytica TaxID=449663 RepID=A0ABQ2PM17_9NEIS|nr:hypothetical protein GCM10010971_22750 [Silvimonas amylolytica]